MENIVIAGVGPGREKTLTWEVREAFFHADTVIGASRMLRDLQELEAKLEAEWEQRESSGRNGTGPLLKTAGSRTYISEYRPEKIAQHIERERGLHPENRYFIAVSGDSSFFSGAAGIGSALKSRGMSVEILPGISSLSYLCAKAGVSLEDVVCISAHGRDANIASCVRRNRKTFVLTGGNAADLLERLTRFGLGDVNVCAGEFLSYEEERISEGTASEMAHRNFAALTSLLIRNPHPAGVFTGGIEDSAFERGHVPMTKREVRALILSHLRLREDSIVMDIGAGTGSVTVEAALTAWRGRVFAIERNPEGIRLIRRNCEKFSADNVRIISGEAPEPLESLESLDSLDSLPAPDAVFIGGSGGRLPEIFEALCAMPETAEERESDGGRNGEIPPAAKGKEVRIVLSAVTLETAAQALRLFESYGGKNVQGVQIAASQIRKAGNYHMMDARNPVFLLSGDFIGSK